MDFSRQVGCHALLQKIFPTQGSNPGLPHCRWILYHLSHQGSPRILERVAYPFSRGSSWLRNSARVSVRFFTSWATREAHLMCYPLPKLKVLVDQSCLTLCNPMYCSLPAPLSMGFSRQEYWSGLPCPPPGGSSRPWDQTQVSCIGRRFFEPPGKPASQFLLFTKKVFLSISLSLYTPLCLLFT